MIKTLSFTGKLAVFASALLYTGVSFGVATATPVHAAASAYYTATLSAPADETRAVAGGVAWSCEGATCVASKASARPLRICRGLNRQFGEVTTFKVDGEDLAADELAKCNA